MSGILPHVSYSVLHIDDAERIPGHGFLWRPLRKQLGTSGFGVNGYTADAGGEVIEDHDERSAGAAGHEELYLVIQGAATFTVDGEEVAAPQGTMVLVPPGTRRGAAGPRTPFEYWYEAEPHYRAKDYAKAVEVASAGLEDWPDHPSLRYQL